MHMFQALEGESPEKQQQQQQQQQQQESQTQNNSSRLHSLLGAGGIGLGGRQDAALANMFSASDISSVLGSRNNSINFLAGTKPERAPSLGLSSMLNDELNNSLDIGSSLGSIGSALGKASASPSIPPHRPMVGGGAAAAYEAAREDHYKNLALKEARKQQQQKEQQLLLLQHQQQQQKQSRLSESRSHLGQLGGLSGTHSQHYEMLKLHHMNLLKEIQETTLMMNVYQQQQQQQADALLGRSNNDIMSLHQGQGMGFKSRIDPISSVGTTNTPNSLQALLQQQQQQQQLISNMQSMNNNQLPSLGNHDFSSNFGDNPLHDIGLQQKIRNLTNDMASQKQGITDIAKGKYKLDDEGKEIGLLRKRAKLDTNQPDWM